MTDLERLLIYLEELIEELEQLDDAVSEKVFDLVNGIDALHRMALSHLSTALDERGIDPSELRDDHPSIAWLFDAYSVGVDEHAEADRALDDIRPYIQGHGGEVHVLEVEDGIVRLRLTGACSGCTASDITLTEGIEEALRENFPGFVSVVVEEDEHAEEHAPPGPTLVELRSGRRDQLPLIE